MAAFIGYSFFRNEGYEISRMRDSLIEKVKEIISVDKNINFVVVSGDLVYQNASYNSQLTKFLELIIKICNISKVICLLFLEIMT